MTELAAWLEKHGLGQFAQVLAENDIDMDVLASLTEDDLKELGFSIGHRRRFMNALKEASPPPAPIVTDVADAVDDRVSGERRQLTVMFCDLVGSTELSERLDPEEMRSVLQRYHAAVANAIAEQEGHVAKLLGDGVLAYFGWPKAHEDAAQRSVLAGLAAVGKVSELNDFGEPLAARVGIATGLVVIGDMIGDVASERDAIVGSTPNLAARLQAKAQSGEVVIHSVTRRLIGAAFDLEERGTHALRGFKDPVAIWQVRGLATTTTRFEALHGSQLSGFVGRAQEIGLLDDRWERARDGEGQVVLLSGEAGIGKSRIIREFSQARKGDCHILRYQCSPHEVNAAFHPIIAEMSASAGILPSDETEQRLSKLGLYLSDIFGTLNEAGPIFTTLLSLPSNRYPPLDMAPQRRKQRTIALLSDRIIRLSSEMPILVIAEDLHWSDPSSLEALDALIEGVQEAPVLVIATTRPSFSPNWGAYDHVTLHSLNRVSRGAGRAIAEEVAGGKKLPDEVLDRILAQTDGIPLFVEELTKTVLEAELLEEREDRYLLSGPLPPLAIPSTLHDSLMARLDRLASVKRVIQAAACIGREFEAELLSAAASLTEEELRHALDQLLSAQLVFRRSGAIRERYIFKHALVQDAAYESLLKSDRQTLHARLAEALEQRENPDTLELARHHFEAGAHDRAARLYLSTGQDALAANALPEAIGALEMALRATEKLYAAPDRDRLELDVRVALGTARMANFGWAHPSVSAAMEPAFTLAKSFEDDLALASILWGLWVHYQTRTNFPKAHEWLSELENSASQFEHSDLPLVYDMSAGCQYFWEAEYQRALWHTDRLRSVYDPTKHARITAFTNHDPLVFSQHWAGSLAEWIAGRPERSIERMQEAVALARKIGHPFNLVFALTAGATSLIYLNEANQLLEFCDEAYRVAEEEALGPFSEHVNVMQWRGGAHIQRGDYELGYSLAKKGNDFWTASGGKICTAMFRSWLVLGLQGLKRLEDAAALNTANIAHCRETGDCYMEPECLRLHGELLLQRANPDPSGAHHFFQEAITVAQRHEAKSWELRAAMSLARLLQSQEEHKAAIAALEPVLEWFKEGMDTGDLVEARELISSLQ